jgi:hypothetical protein
MEGEPLNECQLRRLDTELDDYVGKLPLLREDPSIALAQVLHAFEDAICGLPPGDIRSEQAALNLLDGLHFAVLWCFKHCSVAKARPDLSFRSKLEGSAREILRAASQYSKAFDLMSMMWRKMGVGRTSDDGTVHISVDSRDAQLVLLAGRLTGRPMLPEAREDIKKARDSFSYDRFRSASGVRKVGKRAITYDVPSELFENVALQQRNVLKHCWELDETWDLGGYTVRHFRDFWIAVTALASIHACACSAIVKTRRRWESEISKYSGVDITVVQLILKDVTFDSTLYGEGKSKPDLFCQPFIPIADDLLVLSGWLVRLVNSEVALWHLLSIIRPNIHSVIRNKKERFWLSKLIPMIADLGLHASGPYKFEYGNQSSDLDLLAVDEVRRFAVAFQLKWLKPPEDVRDRDYNDRELRIGIDQAALALEWLQSAPAELSRRSGLDADALKTFNYNALVLSKNTLGTGGLPVGIPVVNEPLLQYTLGDPHRRNLETLYRISEERRYLPKEGTHFVWRDLSASFGGIHFVGEGFGTDLLRPWNPLTDLDVGGLN